MEKVRLIHDIQAALTDFAQRDNRVYYCQLEADKVVKQVCQLTGSVLDDAVVAEVEAELAARFPEISFDMSRVKRLRQTPAQWRVVATNVTSLMREPSWQAEQMSQLLWQWQVEVLLQQKEWAFVRQADGYLGWVYQPYLAEAQPSTATHLVSEPVAILHAAPQATAEWVGRVLGGTAVAVTAVTNNWAQVNGTGWLPAASLRPLDQLPQDANGRRQTIIQAAYSLMGVPYQWGGSTALGIDCSGFAQLTHRLAGLQIPRDADMQFNAGKPAASPFQPGDLLFFGSERGHRAISHVGISLGGWQTIHSSRSRNGVYTDNVETTPSLQQSYIGARTFIT